MSTGLTLTRLKDFSPCLEKAVRFTMAAVEPYTGDKKEEEGWTKIYLTINVKTETEQTMLLASLHNTTLPNQALDFLVTPLDNLKICCEGASKRVFLTGHWLEEDEDDMSDDYSDDEDDLDEDELMDDDEDDDDSDDKRVVELGMDDEDSEDDDEEDDDDDEEEEEVEEAPVAAKRKLAAKETPKKKIKEEPTPSKADKKTPKKEEKTPKKEEKTPKKEEKTPKKEEKTPKKEATSAKKTPAKTPGKQVVAGGVVVQDFKVGDGKKATKGKRCSMYYEGRLANGKVFDSTKSGKGFAFRLGGGEVIKGWDVGVEGMQVGGQRRLTIPPAFAYGKKGAPPEIPKNATLTFDVQLVDVK